MPNLKKPAIMVNVKGKTFNAEINNNTADCRIIFPVSQYTNGRPSWLTLNGQRKAYHIPINSLTQFPVLVLAYRENEFEQDGIPTDVTEIKSKNHAADLILEKGNYRIIVKNKAYKIIKDYKLKIN